MHFTWKFLFLFLLFLNSALADTKQLTLQIELDQKTYALNFEVDYSLVTQLCQVVAKLKSGVDKHLCFFMKGDQFPVINILNFHEWIYSHVKDFRVGLPKNFPQFEQGKLTYKKDGFWFEREHLDFLAKDQVIEFFVDTKPKLTYKFLVK